MAYYNPNDPYGQTTYWDPEMGLAPPFDPSQGIVPSAPESAGRGGGGWDWQDAEAGGGLGGELGGAIGDLVGELMGAGADREQALKYLQERLGLWGDLPQEQVSLAGPSAYGSIRRDPNLRAAEMDTLAELGTVASSGGLDARSLARREAVRRARGEQEFGIQRGLASRQASRGARAPGLDVLMAGQAGQAGADRASMEGLQVAADANERALAAARQRANLAGNIGAADWQRDATAAAAQNALNQFNAQAQNNMYARQLQAEIERRKQRGYTLDDLAEERRQAAGRWGRIGRGIGRGVGAGAGFALGGMVGGPPGAAIGGKLGGG